VKASKLRDSFKFAIEGVGYVLKTQRNMRLHFISAIAILAAGLILKISYLELAILSLTIALVIIAEMFNTAVEVIIDLQTSERHPIAKIIKDIAAGAVLISAINAVAVGFLIFTRHLILLLYHLRDIFRWDNLLTIFLIVVGVVTGLLSFFGSGRVK
jgi:diacylglycerol kinase (ATP)